MGFRKDAYATIWSVNSKSDKATDAQISISKKNKDTGEYEVDFSGFVRFVGSATAQKALRLKERNRIKLGDVDVTRHYDKSSGREYTNFVVFNFEDVQQKDSPSTSAHTTSPDEASENLSTDEPDNDLPF